MRKTFFQDRIRRQLSMIAFSCQSFFWISAGVSAGALFAFFVGRHIPYVGTAVSLLIVLLGLLSGLWMHQASLALTLPILYGGEKIQAGYLRETLDGLVNQLHPAPIDLYVLDHSPMGATVFVAGFFPFKPRIFVEKSLVTTVAAEDWEPIFAHELAHVRLRHLRDRSMFLFRTIFFCILFSTMVLTGLSLIGLSKGIEFASLLSAFLPIILCQLGNQRLIIEQEDEADLLASLIMKDGKAKLSRALRRISSLQGSANPAPATEARLKKLAA